MRDTRKTISYVNLLTTNIIIMILFSHIFPFAHLTWILPFQTPDDSTMHSNSSCCLLYENACRQTAQWTDFYLHKIQKQRQMMISNIEMVALAIRICTVWRFATRNHNIESYLVRRDSRLHEENKNTRRRQRRRRWWWHSNFERTATRTLTKNEKNGNEERKRRAVGSWCEW